MVDLILFFIPASLIIIGALIVVFAKNPVHNAMGLVMTLVSIAIIYITLNATFVAMVQMLVYAGAVMTLFLFVIMMIGVDKKEQSSESIKGQTFLVSGVFLILISLLSYVAFNSEFKWDLWFDAGEIIFETCSALSAE